MARPTPLRVDRPKFALATLRTMREGFRFANRVPAEIGAPAVVNSDGRNPLEEYFDAVTEGPGVWKWRHYFPIYQRHLSKFVGHEVTWPRSGSKRRQSANVATYFGQGCRSTGWTSSRLPRPRAGRRPRVHRRPGRPELMERFSAKVPRIDVVIDNGGHRRTADHSLRCTSPGSRWAALHMSGHHQPLQPVPLVRGWNGRQLSDLRLRSPTRIRLTYPT